MMRINIYRYVFVIIISLQISACERARDSSISLTIQELKPSGEIPLVGGTDVKFEGVVQARNIPLESSVALVVQAADGTVLGIAGPTSITDSQLVQLNSTVKIPATTSITVFAPLYFGGKTQSETVDSRVYKVIGVTHP